jgi:hypothetical protein
LFVTDGHVVHLQRHRQMARRSMPVMSLPAADGGRLPIEKEL